MRNAAARALAPLATLAAAAALVLLPVAGAHAHPLGNFTVSQYDGVVVAPGKLSVRHVEDLAEIPATQERKRVDADGDGRLSEAELSTWARARCDAAAQDARLTVAGQADGGSAAGSKAAVSPVPGSARAEVRPGQAGLPTLRTACTLTAPLTAPSSDGAPLRLTYIPADVSTGAGWREITAQGDRMTLSESDVPRASVSRELTAYPDDLLSSPPGVRSAALVVRSGGPPLEAGAHGADEDRGSPAAAVLPRGADRWAQALTGLVARHELTAGFAALALGVSLLLGAMHALAPGHGKTMMAAAAAARGRGSTKEVLALGASVTVTHTLGVFLLGALITAGSAAAPTVVSWLTVVSGATVAVAGALLLRRAWRLRRLPHGHGHSHGHGHGHGHEHDHGRGHGHHEHDHGVDHAHEHRHDEARAPALAGAHRSGHDTPGAAAGPVTVPESAADARPRGAGHGHPHRHSHGHDHDHGHDHGHGHSHVPPAPGVRGVVLMGLAGGLVPSPSAVVVLVGAAALGQAWFGFLLVLAYGAGLALTLAGAGLAVIRLRDTTARRLARRPQGRLFSLFHRFAPLGTAAVVLTLGCGLLTRGLAATLS
ncbi:nickel transporter [Streptomyces sp. MUM 178J]|uniref:nickel transporter n=1 Tax=Streptomyces sp. MUM 178J TaxID=2791991 RepID=UPI001F04FBE1|nr:nickel transporter [Streptomyces sp. MUM 178J]WRQ78008.1 nickel transporter [Streptomyces sp. MUM 178J]